MIKKAATSIEITNAEIKIFQAKTLQGKDVVTFCDVRSARGSSHEETVKLLKEMMASMPDPAEDVCLLLPRREVILRQMRFPSDDAREIEDMIGLQLLNNIPYPVEDILYRHLVLDKDAQGYQRVLVVILQKSKARKYYQIMHEAGIKDGKVTVHSLGVLGWLDHQARIHKDLAGNPAALVNISLAHTEVCFCADGKLFYSRNIPYGRDYLRTHGPAELIDEVKLSLAAYKNDGLGPEVIRMLIVVLPEDGEILRLPLERACLIPVDVFDPLNGILGAPDKKGKNLKGLGVSSVTACVGVLFSGVKSWLNLAPGEIHEEKRRKTGRRRLVRFLVLLASVIGLSIASEIVDIHKKSEYLRSVESEIESLNPQIEKIIRKKKLVTKFEEKLNNYGFIPELMDELTRVTPEKVSFRTLSLDSKRNLMIQGYADTHADINDFQTQLIHSALFSNVDLKFATKRKIANIPVMDFKMASHLTRPAEDEL